MATQTVPKSERVQIVSQSMLRDGELTLRNAENGTDVLVYGSETDEGAGYPLRTDDEWVVEEGDDGIGTDGLWMETTSAAKTTIQVLKGVKIRRNVRRSVLSDVEKFVELGPFTDRVTTAGNYATISPGGFGDPAAIVVDASGTGTLTVEVSTDGGNTWDAYTQSYDSNGLIEEVASYGDVRAKASASLNALTISAKGV